MLKMQADSIEGSQIFQEQPYPMRKVSVLFSWMVIAVGFLLASEKQAHAYADPGSSLLILQTVGSIVTATGLYFRRRIASFFKRGKSTETETEANEQTVSPAAK
jgi:hypothetical protein